MELSSHTDKICNEVEVFEELLSLDDKNIIDLGCGKADITRLIATNGIGRNITATEVDEIQHRKNILIDDLPNVTFMIAGSEALTIDDELFDIAFMFKSLHHVPIDLMEKALKETKRILKPGGLVYISEPVFEGDFNEVLRLFHDEEAVREAAYRTIKKSVENEDLLLVKELFFNTTMFFESFEDFENKYFDAAHLKHPLSPIRYQRVKDQFSLNLQENGATFLMPIRVDLLQKKI